MPCCCATKRCVPGHAGFGLCANTWRRVLCRICYCCAILCQLRITDVCSSMPRISSGIAARIQRKDVSAVTSRERQIYKTVVLGLLYGQGQKSLAAKLNMTESQSAKTISTFFNTFPKVSLLPTRESSPAADLEILPFFLSAVGPSIHAQPSSPFAAPCRPAHQR